LEKNIFPFPLTPAKLLGGDQTISNGAAKMKKSAKSVALILMVLLTRFHYYNGAICIAAPLIWWNRVSSTNSIGANARKKWQKCHYFY
jgi:hypothetical protein